MDRIMMLNYVSDEQIKQIHEASLEILWKYGVYIQDEEIRELMKEYGCVIDDDRVKIPADLIEKVLKNLKSSIVFKNLSEKEVVIKPGEIRTHATGGMPFILDSNTNERREATTQDLIDSIKIMNELENLDLPCAYVSPSDIENRISQLKQCEYMFRYSKKPVYGLGVSSPVEAKYMVEIFNACKIHEDGSYNGLVGVSPDAPLSIPTHISETLKIMIQGNVPVSILSAPVAGISGPITVAGSVAQMHAEIISMTVLAYIFNPETPVLYGSRVCFANMKNGNSVWGTPEMGVASGLAAQLARYCGFMSDLYGLTTASCSYDEQCGFEKAINTLIPAMSGSELISGFGSMASVMLASLKQLVIDDEIFRDLKYSLNSIEVDKDTLALDVIGKVSKGGSFLTQKHTVKQLRRKKMYTPNLAFESAYNDWQKLGSKKIDEVAAEKVNEIINKPNEEVISKEVSTKLDEIISIASQSLLNS